MEQKVHSSNPAPDSQRVTVTLVLIFGHIKVTSNYYSILYYNSKIWQLPSLNTNLKQKLLSSSAKALKMCAKFNTDNISFVRLHEMYNRATPENFLLYKYSLELHQLFNTNEYNTEWVYLNLNQKYTSRQSKFITIKSNQKKVGLNALANRLSVLNNKIPLKMFNSSHDSFKIFSKKMFL